MKLYFAPGTCARVPLVALEEIGEPFETGLISFVRGDHKSPEFLAINPKARVPALITDEGALTENIAILTYLARTHPNAGLLPLGKGAYQDALVLGDLSWASSGLHPIVTRLRIPQFFCDTEGGKERVWEIASAAMHPNFALIEQRLSAAPWMLGEEWSILDVYIFWVWFRVEGTDFDLSPYLKYNDHAQRIQERPSVQRALAREAEALAWLEENGLTLDFNKLSLPKSDN